VWADSSSGIIVNGKFVPRRIYFEVGRGLAELLAAVVYPVAAARNQLTPHLWDETQTCLPVGATEVWVDGHHAADLPLTDLPPGKPPGRWVVLQTDPVDPAIPARRLLVRLVAVTDELDPLAAGLGTSTNVTHLVWEQEQALPFEMDLELAFTVRGNMVPVTAGKTQRARFSIGPNSGPFPVPLAPALVVPRAVERTGGDATVAFLFTLQAEARKTSANEPVEDPDDTLVWLPGASSDPRSAAPEVHLTEVTAPAFAPGDTWQWRRSFLGVGSSEPQDKHFTLDDGTWTRVVGYQRLGGEIVHVDYLAGTGTTVRFGDGQFGRIPPRGSGNSADDSLFEVTWRAGNGKRSNVPAAAIAKWRGQDATDLTDPPRPGDPPLAFISSLSNPLATIGGLDPESAADIKKLAPDAWRQITYRAVRPEDYAEAAERLPWVQRAGAAFRWTGSWLTTFVTADPLGAATLTDERRDELELWVDRFRQAGRELHVRAPRYVDLDLVVRICVDASSYPGDVEEAVLVALFGKKGVRPVMGFFDPDRFTFGTPLDRSELEAAIQRVPGVRAVEAIHIRRRGWFPMRPFVSMLYTPAPDEVIRIENDPRHPDRGTLRLVPKGGA
jgi:predicted phage baseplate assembly protein